MPAPDYPPNADAFRAELYRLFDTAAKAGADFINVNAGDLHRTVGGYPGTNHRMPSCCNVMYGEHQPGDVVLEAPEKGYGAALTIRYKIPR